MTAAKFRRIGLFGGPLLGLLCYHLLPLQYSRCRTVGRVLGGQPSCPGHDGLNGNVVGYRVGYRGYGAAAPRDFPAVQHCRSEQSSPALCGGRDLPCSWADLSFGLAIEGWGLDRRIAFFTLRLVGARPGAITGGLMAVTAFLSMWVSNTASRR